MADENRPEGERGGSELEEGGQHAAGSTRDQAEPGSDLVSSGEVGSHRRGGGVARRAGRLMKDHPVATVAAVAGAAALLRAKVTAAALAGIGVTALLARQTGPETRSRMRAIVQRGRSWLAHRLSRLQSLVAPPHPAETAVPWKL